MRTKWDIRILKKQVQRIYIIPVLVIIGLLLVRHLYYQEKWKVLVSQEYGYQIEYPANWWGEVTSSGRGSDYLHGRINNNYLFPRSYLRVYYDSIENPTFDVAAIWAETIIEKDCGYVCWEGFQPQKIGEEDILTLNTTYEEEVSFGQTIYNKATVIVTDTGVYMLKFSAYNLSQNVEEKFDHMLTSFEVFEEEAQ